MVAGANTWPGANILQLQDGSKYMLRAGALRRAADELRIGDIVQVLGDRAVPVKAFPC